MPIAKWICSHCGGREVDIDHFATTVCGEKVHPDYCAAILKDRGDQYVSKAVRVSHGLGCPRRAAIEESEPFAIDPLELNAPLKGTAWHAFVEKAAPPDMAEVEVEGVIAGTKVRGKADRVRVLHDGTVAIEDWKTGSDFQIKYRKADGIKPEHLAQLSIYAELFEQSGRPRPTVGLIWNSFSIGGNDAMFAFKSELMDIESALQVKPYGETYTVAELIKQAGSFFDGDVPWQKLPLVGESMFFGAKNACSYCGVRSVCWEEAKLAPF